MSLPSNGSTAPTIASPLIAWPAKPQIRNSPLSTPSTGTFDTSSFPSFYSRQMTTTSQGSESQTSLSTSYSNGYGVAGDQSGWDTSYERNTKGKGRALETPKLTISADGDGYNGNTYLQDSPESSESARRRYPPPTKPLNPHQLGRIAQSFGIVIPSLASMPSPTLSARSSSPSSNSRTTRPYTPYLQSRAPTPFLLTVIPPLILIPSSSQPATPDPDYSDPLGSEDRAKRWKRGRLLPLQPTLGSMLVSIAREYGLPSTIGIGVHLVTPVREPSASLSPRLDSDYPSGPLISAQTWSTLFYTYIHHSSTTSATSSPTHTPMKKIASVMGGHHDEPMPASPLSLVNRYQSRSFSAGPSSESTPTKITSKSSSDHSSADSSSSALPPTPSSLLPTSANYSSDLQLPIVGRIEFDIDLETAVWFEEWKKSGGATRRKGSTGPEGHAGLRELQLVGKMNDQDRSPRFLRDLKVPSISSGSDSDRADTSYAPLDDGTEESFSSDSDPLADLFPTASSEFAALRETRPSSGRKLSITDIGTNRVLSTAASYGEFPSEDDEKEGRGFEMEKEVEEIKKMLDEHRALSGELLASPIALETAELEKVHQRRERLEDDDKRGSGLVMSDQLDDLEKLMRSLSPRDIRLTSPKLMTPRMAAKVTNLSLPSVPRAKLPTSPLAGTFTQPPASTEIDNDTTPTAPPLPERSLSRAPTTPQVPGRQAWPAIPYVKLTESPGSPSNITEYFKPPTEKIPDSPTTISDETLQRMVVEPPKPVSGGWKPQRPVRPPSPDLDFVGAIAQSMSPEIEGLISRSPGSSATSQAVKTTSSAPVQPPPSTAQENPNPKLRSRSSSISLRGLRNQMSSKNLWQKKDERTPDVPSLPRYSTTVQPTEEPIGLFKGVDLTQRPSTSSFRSSDRVETTLSSAPPTTQIGVNEFGQVDNGANGSGSLPLKSSSGLPSPGVASTSISSTGSGSGSGSGTGSGFARMLGGSFGFSRRQKESSVADSTAREKISLDLGKKGKRSPSVDQHLPAQNGANGTINAPIKFISSPIMSTVHVQRGVIEITPENDPLVQRARTERSQSSDPAPSLTSFKSYGIAQTNGHASQRSISVSNPSTTYVPKMTSSPSLGSPGLTSLKDVPGSPASPRSVRRKPVPGVSADGEERGVTSSLSMGSVASFVLDPVPKKAMRGLGIGMQEKV